MLIKRITNKKMLTILSYCLLSGCASLDPTPIRLTEQRSIQMKLAMPYAFQQLPSTAKSPPYYVVCSRVKNYCKKQCERVVTPRNTKAVPRHVTLAEIY